eukprot:4799124-Karenia_brevis.AAC.1
MLVEKVQDLSSPGVEVTTPRVAQEVARRSRIADKVETIGDQRAKSGEIKNGKTPLTRSHQMTKRSW